MEYISRTVHDGIARVVIHRGKVNALNDSVIDEMSRSFGELALDPSVRAITLTGTGKFFSFGFDIPHAASSSRSVSDTTFEEFVRIWYSEKTWGRLQGKTIHA